ncbi:D-alanyl-D-alanine carboxypeptidase family protein [Candidatus Levibacter sp. Uisw_134_01]|uniref:D-alanyl-D-alanine carboxypeptidase family protein n=1 Tax=Candidatus Levibacter sp. Uisw_134_01 TaxID=3230999 RepID=UPI003D40BF76
MQKQRINFYLLFFFLLSFNFIWMKKSISQLLDIKSPAKQVIIYDHEADEVLFEKNADQIMKPASMAKVMTAYIIFDKLKDQSLQMSDTFLVSNKAWRMGGSRSFLELNTNVSIKDLLLGLIVQSGNDAAVVLAEGVSGGEEAFAREMNRYAKILGMNNTYFTNATGWPHPDLKTTSRDLVILTRNIINNFPKLYELFNEKIFNYNNIKQSNRNPLLYSMNGADGLKTGHTNESGYGLIGSVKKNNRRVSIVINGLNSKKKRTFESKRLFNIVFRETALLSLFNDKKSLASANIWLGKQPQVDLVAEKAFKKIISPLELNKTKIKIQWKDPIAAPITKGDKVGDILIDIPGKELIKQNIVSTQNIDTMSTFMKAKSILMYLLYGEFVVK